MLDGLRKFAHSVFGKAFFLILAVAFGVLWGGGDYFYGGGSRSQVLVTVGGQKLSTYDLQKAVAREARKIEVRLGRRLEPAEIQASGLMEVVLQNKVSEMLLDLEADRMDLIVSDEEVATVVRNDPLFHDDDGEFDADLFKQRIQTLGMDEAEFTEELRKSLRRRQLLAGVSPAILVPPVFAEPLLAWKEEKRNISFVALSPDMVSAPRPPKQDVLKAFYQKNVEKFVTQEQRDAEILVINESLIQDRVELSNEEIEAGFEKYKADLKGISRLQAMNQVMKQLKAEKAGDELYALSAKIEDEFAGGATLAEVAEKFDLGVGVVKGISQTPDGKGRQYTSYHLRKKEGVQSEKPLEGVELQTVVREAFTQKENSDLELTPAGDHAFVAVQLVKREPSRQLTFKEAESSVFALWRAQKIKEALREKSQKLVEKAKSISLENALPAVGFTRARAERKTLARFPEKGVKPAIVRLHQRAFSPDVLGASSFAFEEDIYVFKVNKVLAANLKGREKELETFANGLSRLIAEDVLTQFINALKVRYKVEYNRSLLEGLRGNSF